MQLYIARSKADTVHAHLCVKYEINDLKDRNYELTSTPF